MIARCWVGPVVVSIGLVGLVGCGNSAHPEPMSSAASTATSTSALWSRPDAPPDPRTLLRAGATALDQVPGSTLVFIQSQTDDAGTWKTELATADGAGQEVKIGVDGIAVLVGPTPHNDSDTDKAQRRADVQAARLDYRAATDRALVAVPNGSITELRLAETNGTVTWAAVVWDTELVEHQVTIDAASGQVTANKQI